MVHERYQRPEVKDLGTKWKIFYWDYTVTPRIKRTKDRGRKTRGSARSARCHSRRSSGHVGTQQEVSQTR